MSFTWEHVLYRLYDEDGALLYVGITHSISTRFKTHAGSQPWWSEVAGCRVEFHPDRAAVERAERDAIWHERPRYNVRGSVTPPTSTFAPPRRRILPELVQSRGYGYGDVAEKHFYSPDEWARMNGQPPRWPGRTEEAS